MGARDALEMATLGRRRRASAATGEIGELSVGAVGDLVCWPLEGIPFAGALSDPIEAWLRCGPVAARHTIVPGVPVVEDGQLTAPGVDEILARHRHVAEDWARAAGALP